MMHDDAPFRILVIDDHPAIRKGLALLLATRGHRVQAEAGSLAEALDVLDDQQFDIALLDLTLQDGNGQDLLPELEARDISSIVYTMHEEADIIERSLHLGALGYVSKQEDEDILFVAIETVAGGKRYLSPCAAQCLEKNQAGEGRLEDVLSDRERQIFLLIGKGFGNTEIAEKLGLSRRTVETYCSRMVRKLDFEGRSDLRKYAISVS